MEGPEARKVLCKPEEEGSSKVEGGEALELRKLKELRKLRFVFCDSSISLALQLLHPRSCDTLTTVSQNNDIYRQAASVLLLRVSENGHEILLLHKPRKNDAWQLPQGGIEAGESIEQAAMRELHEEAGVTGAKVFGQSAECYKYDFPPSFRRFRRDNVCGQCIHYVFALADKQTVVTVDNNEINDFRWVSPAQLPEYFKRKAYLELAETLLKEALAVLPS